MQDGITPRSELHHLIRREFSIMITSWYRAHPELLLAEESDMQTRALLKLMECVLEQVDKFDISGSAK